MTCVDVMYQPFTSAFPAYPRPTCSADFTHGQSLSRMQEPLDLGPSTSSSSLSPSSLVYPPSSLLTPSSSGPPSGPTIVPSSSPSSPPLSSSSSSRLVKAESEKDTQPKVAHYLTANCVLFTYFTGDTATVVDDHFSRALSSDAQSGASKSLSHKVSTPMSARNLPPSFWNSSYQHQHHPHHFLSHSSHHPHPHHHHHLHHQQHHSQSSLSSGQVSSDVSPFHSNHPYLSPALHGLSNIQTDSWAYSFPSTAPALPYPHRPVPYDLSYPATSRFGQNYSSFLMQPSAVRSAQFSSMGGHCDVTKPSEHSRSRFSDPRLASDYTAHHSSFSALDAAGLQEATKDLYWF